mgnify:CR=1 FL=1
MEARLESAEMRLKKAQKQHETKVEDRRNALQVSDEAKRLLDEAVDNENEAKEALDLQSQELADLRSESAALLDNRPVQTPQIANELSPAQFSTQLQAKTFNCSVNRTVLTRRSLSHLPVKLCCQLQTHRVQRSRHRPRRPRRSTRKRRRMMKKTWRWNANSTSTQTQSIKGWNNSSPLVSNSAMIQSQQPYLQVSGSV